MDNQDARSRILNLMNGIPEEKLYPFDSEDKVRFDRTVAGITGFEGLLLRTARYVPANSQVLPGLLVCMKENARLRLVLGLSEVLLVASPLGRGTASITTLMEPPRKMRAPGAPELAPEDLPRRDVSVWPFNIRQRIPFGMIPGPYAIVLIERDWLSNVALLDVREAAADEARRKERLYYLEDALTFAERIKSVRGTQEETIRFGRDGKTPPLEGEGIILSVPGRMSMEGEDAVAHGMLRLKAREDWIVQPHFRDKKEDPAEPFVWTPDRRRDTPRAIISGTILLVRARNTSPYRINLQIPVYADDEFKPGDLMEGFFHVDLRRSITEPLDTGIYWAYLIVGEFVDGPHQLTVQKPDH